MKFPTITNNMLSLTLSILIGLLLLAPAETKAQNNERIPPKPELRKWSIQLHGGTFMARTDLKVTPFTGSTGVKTRYINPSFGGGIEYMFAPALGIMVQANYALLENDSDGLAYENSYLSVSGGANLYLLNLIHPEHDSWWFNPYASAFIGMSQSKWSGRANLNDLTSRHGHYGFGLGAVIRLGSVLDWTLSYQYQMFNPGYDLDGFSNVTGSYDSDRLVGFTTGLSFKIGHSGRSHARWYSPVPANQEWRQRIDEAVTARDDEWDQVLRDIEEQEAQLEQLNRDIQTRAEKRELDQTRSAVTAIESQIRDMENRMDNDLERIEKIHRAAGFAFLTPELERGLYVQTFAAWNIRITHRALLMTRDGLADRGYDVNDLDFSVYQLPNGLFSVQIGGLASMEEANDVLTGTLDIFDDAFIREHQPE